MTAVATVATRSTAQTSAQPSAMAAFRRFHAELLACCAPGQPVDAPPASDRLIAALHALTEAAVPLGPAAHGTTVKAAFAMAMLADRALSGARPGEAVVTSRLFGANATMKTLFVQADDLIRQGSKGDRDLAAVYLAVLSLGFAEDPEAGARRTSLHGVVVGERTQGDRVSPRAYDPPAGAVMGPEQPSSRRWWWALGGAVAAFLLVSHLLWADAVGGIDRDLRGARAAIEDMGMSWSY